MDVDIQDDGNLKVSVLPAEIKCGHSFDDTAKKHYAKFALDELARVVMPIAIEGAHKQAEQFAEQHERVVAQA